MAKVVHVRGNLTTEEIYKKVKQAKVFWRMRRWLIIYQALVEPASSSSIAQRLGVSRQTVKNLVSLYNRHGDKAIDSDGRGQRQRAYLTIEEEGMILSSLNIRAKDGEILTVSKVHQALERHIGHEIHLRTTYRILERHGWRKLAPRPYHPDVDYEKQEMFKKTSRKKSRK